MSSPGYIPGPLIIPDTFQVRLIWTLSNARQVTNVLHATSAGSFDSGSMDTILGDIIGSAEWTAYHPFLPTTTALQAMDIRDLRTANQPLQQSTLGASVGTAVADPLPEEVALVVTLRTALAGRAHRGRVYLPGFAVSAVDASGHATGALTAAAQGLMQRVSDSMFANGLVMAIGHRGHAAYVNHLGQTVPAELAGSDPVTQLLVRDNIFDAQRRRK